MTDTYEAVDLGTGPPVAVDLGGFPVIATTPVVSGPRGPVGPAGPPGVGASFSHHQIGPAATWIITHNLGIYPTPVILLDDAPDEPVLTDITYNDSDSVTLTFPQPVTGWVHI